jgi:hypothetical protein
LPLQFGRTTWISFVAGGAMVIVSLATGHVLFWPLALVLGVVVYFVFFSTLAYDRLANAGRTLRECATGAVG